MPLSLRTGSTFLKRHRRNHMHAHRLERATLQGATSAHYVATPHAERAASVTGMVRDSESGVGIIGAELTFALANAAKRALIVG